MKRVLCFNFIYLESRSVICWCENESEQGDSGIIVKSPSIRVSFILYSLI